MFSGTLTYVYLLWTTYWDRVAKISRDYHRYHQRPFKHPSQAKAVMNQQHHQKASTCWHVKYIQVDDAQFCFVQKYRMEILNIFALYSN